LPFGWIILFADTVIEPDRSANILVPTVKLASNFNSGSPTSTVTDGPGPTWTTVGKATIGWVLPIVTSDPVGVNWASSLKLTDPVVEFNWRPVTASVNESADILGDWTRACNKLVVSSILLSATTVALSKVKDSWLPVTERLAIP